MYSMYHYSDDVYSFSLSPDNVKNDIALLEIFESFSQMAKKLQSSISTGKKMMIYRKVLSHTVPLLFSIAL